MKKIYLFIVLVTGIATAKGQCPSVTVTPLAHTLTCNGFPASFTSSVNSTTNTVVQWFGPGNVPVSSASSSLSLQVSFNSPGTYTFVATNTLSSCVTTQTALVLGDPTVPSMTINAMTGTVITCSSCLMFNITASAGPAPKTYTWTNMSTSVTVTPPTGGYTVCTPGSYLAEYQDGNACLVSEMIYIGSGPCTTGIEALNAEKAVLSVFPNPGNGHFNFKLSDGSGELQIVNSLGALVYRQILSEGANAVNTALAQGIYHYTLIDKDRVLTRGKLVIE